jgi:hypothetical protein
MPSKTLRGPLRSKHLHLFPLSPRVAQNGRSHPLPTEGTRSPTRGRNSPADVGGTGTVFGAPQEVHSIVVGLVLVLGPREREGDTDESGRRRAEAARGDFDLPRAVGCVGDTHAWPGTWGGFKA